MTDPIVEAVRRAREQLLRQYGNFDGVFEHLQRLDRRRRNAKKNQQARRRRTTKVP